MPDSADRPLGHPSETSSADSADSEVITLFEELRLRLRRYLMCLGMTRQDADDGVQEAFLHLHRHVETNGDRTNLRGWLFEVARNLAHDRHRAASGRRMRAKSPDEELATVPYSGDTPENELLKAERIAWIRNAVRRLTRQQAECLQLRAAALRYREIAAAMGMGISTRSPFRHMPQTGERPWSPCTSNSCSRSTRWMNRSAPWRTHGPPRGD